MNILTLYRLTSRMNIPKGIYVRDEFIWYKYLLFIMMLRKILHVD